MMAKKYPGRGGLYRGADQSPIGNQRRQGEAIGSDGVVPARKLLSCHYRAWHLGEGSAKTESAGPPVQWQQSETPLCRTDSLQRVRKPLCADDPVLERQAARGVCVQGIPSEWEKLLQFPPHP